MYIKNSFTPIEAEQLQIIEQLILADAHLTQREKVQCWVWVHASILEGRISENELSELVSFIQKNPHFFKDLIMNLTEINFLIKSKNKEQLTRRLKESVQMVSAIQKMNQV